MQFAIDHHTHNRRWQPGKDPYKKFFRTGAPWARQAASIGKMDFDTIALFDKTNIYHGII
jgi:hypothetical protein